MTKITLLLAAAAFTGAFAAEGGAAATAGEPDAHAAIAAHVKAADVNKDGAIDATELAAIKDEAVKAKLVAIDANADGTIEATEVETAKKAKKAEKKAEKAEKKDH